MNPRNTIIFGNGIGMSVDSNYFQMKSGLHHVWNNTDLLSSEHKKLIQSVLPKATEESYPESEEMLNDLQKAISASELLSRYETKDAKWLNDHSREIVAVFKRFIHQVALYFQQSNLKLPSDFTNALSSYISTSKSHIAILNYDNLLYDVLCSNQILRGYSGTLIDGFTNNGFNIENLDRRDNVARLGWFLNLHGSPLFVDNMKHSGAYRDFLKADEKCHIVLTHVNHKPAVIETSHILNEYWKRLEIALSESQNIILFGYSGLDTHLNKIITKFYKKEKRVVIIEWEGAGDELDRQLFWIDALYLSSNFSLIRMENILSFQNWSQLFDN
jgi:hypothetical protein